MPTFYVEDHPERLAAEAKVEAVTEAKVVEPPAKQAAKKSPAKVTTKA